MPGPARRGLALAALVVAVAILAACAGATRSAPAAAGPSATPAPAGPVGVSLKEWRIELTVRSAKAGTVRFAARNDGAVPHDLVVVKGDIAADRLPTVTGLLDESKVTIVGRTEQLTPGDGKTLSVELPKGTYVLVCNVIGHYNSGQFAVFTAE